MFRTERPRKTLVQQGLNHLSLQHGDFHTNRGRLPVVPLRSELFGARPYETDTSFDFELEVSFFVDDVAEVLALGRLSVPLASCFGHVQWDCGYPIPCS